MIRIVAILILIGIAVAIALSFSMDKTNLSADQDTQIFAECAACHSSQRGGEENDAHPSNPELVCTRCHHDFHQVHANAACIKCHAGDDGLQNADDAHNIVQWAGIGIVGATAAGLALNLTIARRKLS